MPGDRICWWGGPGEEGCFGIHSGGCASVAIAGNTGLIVFNKFLFFGYALTCGILVPWLGIETVPPALEAWSHWTTREVHDCSFIRDLFLWSQKTSDSSGDQCSSQKRLVENREEGRFYIRENSQVFTTPSPMFFGATGRFHLGRF